MGYCGVNLALRVAELGAMAEYGGLPELDRLLDVAKGGGARRELEFDVGEGLAPGLPAFLEELEDALVNAARRGALVDVEGLPVADVGEERPGDRLGRL